MYNTRVPAPSSIIPRGSTCPFPLPLLTTQLNPFPGISSSGHSSVFLCGCEYYRCLWCTLLLMDSDGRRATDQELTYRRTSALYNITLREGATSNYLNVLLTTLLNLKHAIPIDRRRTTLLSLHLRLLMNVRDRYVLITMIRYFLVSTLLGLIRRIYCVFLSTIT